MNLSVFSGGVVLLAGASVAVAGWLPVPATSTADRGEVLIGELNCAACHGASPAITARLASRQAPVLGENGWRITPQWLRAYLADPPAIKPGTVMPDSLHDMPPDEKARAADALAHYLISLQSPQDVPGIMNLEAAARGRVLYHTVGCVACHLPQEPPAHAPADARTTTELAAIERTSSSLARPEMKTSLAQMVSFLRDPLKIRPAGRMPAMKLGDDEATAIATYLLRGQSSTEVTQDLPGLVYDYYEDILIALPKFERLRAKETGITDRINLDKHRRDDNFALRFRGDLTVATEGEYTFYVTSDDGAQLRIDDKPVVDNSGIHPAQEHSGTITLKPGGHPFILSYFNNVGNRELGAAWSGPGIPKQEIPADRFSHRAIPMVPVGTEAFMLDAAKVEEGRKLYTSLNCASCHQLGSEQSARFAKPLASLDPGGASSCISPTAALGLPKYEIDDEDRQAIRATLAALPQVAQPLTPAAQVQRTMTSLNCYACHNRDQRGGPDGIRREYFSVVGDADLGDEGRLPPHLDSVGAKLRPEAIQAILWQGAVARPYMATRMPQFGRANVESLVPAFGAADDPTDASAPEIVLPPNAAAYGRKLAGTGGLACIACHNFNNHPSLGIPAVDMTLMYDRVKPAWFHRYVIDPQALRPGTRMPSFWPDGRAANKDILGGDTEKQIASLWGYLAKAKDAELPDGLIAGKMELIPRREALIYRNFIQGAGPRGIGVGYPEKVNLAFDADEMRIDLLWQGSFMDASHQRTGRAQGWEPPLGSNVVSWTTGAPLAYLAQADAPWPAPVGKPAGFQFRGYRLDKERRPAFLYSFKAVQVEDYTVPAPGEVEAGLRRTLSFHAEGDPSGLFFRAAVADKIEARDNNVYLVNGKVFVALSGAQPRLRDGDGKKELLVPISFRDGSATIEEVLTW